MGEVGDCSVDEITCEGWLGETTGGSMGIIIFVSMLNI